MTAPKKALQYIEIDVDRCANTFGVLPCRAAVTAVGAQTVVDPTLSTNTAGAGGLTRRQWIAAAALANIQGNRIRLTFTPPTSGGNTVLSNVFVGHAGAAPNFDGGQVRVTFAGGTNGVTLIGGGASVVSDDIVFPFDPTKALIVAMDITGTSSIRYNAAAGANFVDYLKAGDGANVGATTVSGYSSTAALVTVVDLVQVLTVPTGSAKCFNFKKACQNAANYINAPATLRFAVPTAYLPTSIDCDPCIQQDGKGIQFDPATLSLGTDLGQRATLTVNFDDHPDSDTGPTGDKYRSSRSYDPFKQGSFFGKLRSRQPYLRGRPLRWITGFVGDALADMTTHHFIIDSFTGPTLAGVFTIVAKDVLKLADGDRALAPAPSNGFLSADLTTGTTSATLLPVGVGAEYAASGYVNIGGSEICGFTRSGDVLTLTRAQLGTPAATHNGQDRVQTVIRYAAADPANIIADLFENYAGIPSSYVPIADWLVETSTHLNTVYTATIANPTSVNTLVSELLEIAGAASWQRDDALTLGLQVLRGIDTSAATFAAEDIFEGTLTIQEQPDKRISRVVIYFGQINPLTSLTDAANYRSNTQTPAAIAAALEANYGSPVIKQIFSRWIPAGGRAVADRIAAVILSRYQDPPRKFGFSLLRGSVPVLPVLAQGFRLRSWPIQDDSGAPALAPIEVTRVNPGPALIVVEAEEMLFSAPPSGALNVTLDFSTNNVNLRSVFDTLYLPPKSGDSVVCTILAGVTIGSTSTSLPAFDVGTWPAGVNVTLDVRGRIEGCGGVGGASVSVGTDVHAFDGLPGSPGGPALYLRRAISLKVSTGKIFGGGGGGGGGASYAAIGGGGGGGGGGVLGGVGGIQGTGFYGSGNPGSTGSPDAGGSGGVGSAPDAEPGTVSGSGGNGGGPGLVGATGGPGVSFGEVFSNGGPGGAPGAAIDGFSLVTITEGPGDIRGPEIN